jgi:hypothetical protein
LSEAPGNLPDPASNAIWTLAGKTAINTAVLAAEAHALFLARPKAQASSSTPLA